MVRVNQDVPEHQKSYPDEAAAFARYQWQVNKTIPATPGYFHRFACRICGAVVVDQYLHFRWHTNERVIKVLSDLFVKEVDQ